MTAPLVPTWIVEARPLRAMDAPMQRFEVAGLRAHAARRAFVAAHPEMMVVSVTRRPS